MHDSYIGSNNFEVTTNSPTTRPGQYEKLSRILYKSLPSQEDTELICNATSYTSISFLDMLTMPYTTLDQNGRKSPEGLLERPGPNAHPVLIARYMLHLALFLQHLNPDSNEIKGLSEPSRVMMQRLVDTVFNQITLKDELLGSIEGLECVMMESQYEANGGNLRRSWVVARRAMVIAQLMGLHRSHSQAQYKMLDPKRKAYPQFMWFRIASYDRHLCLLLGLPQGSLDRSMDSDRMLLNDTPMGRLERIHSVLASRILERNESDMRSYDFALTQDLDMQLQRAAKHLPSKWWLIPNLSSIAANSQVIFWDSRRLLNQLFHYNLLNQLHLPYMLRSSVERKYDYSKVTCVNASRELLARFIMFRDSNRTTSCCRTIDFFALMAAMTLLLAHLDSRRSSQTDNILAHQYLSDRAMMEQAQENMEAVSRLNTDALSGQSADLLRRLLAIEAETADGHSRSAETVRPHEDDNSIVRVYIPCFGTIKITREGVISKEKPRPQAPIASNAQNQPTMAGGSGMTSSDITYVEAVDEVYNCTEEHTTVLQPGSDAPTETETRAQPWQLLTPKHGDAMQFAPQSPNAISEALLQQYHYPELTVGVDDRAFQGVDTAFFDSLMRGAGDDGRGGAERAAWQNEPNN